MGQPTKHKNKGDWEGFSVTPFRLASNEILVDVHKEECMLGLLYVSVDCNITSALKVEPYVGTGGGTLHVERYIHISGVDPGTIMHAELFLPGSLIFLGYSSLPPPRAVALVVTAALLCCLLLLKNFFTHRKTNSSNNSGTVCSASGRLSYTYSNSSGSNLKESVSPGEPNDPLDWTWGCTNHSLLH